MGLGRPSDGLAPTPPMGWNSWNAFKGDIDERLILENAETLVASGMREVGYRYVVVDDGWMAPERDRAGNLVPDPAKFPRGIAYVADRVHALGLRFGIYTDAGTKTCLELPASLGYEFRDAHQFAAWGVDFVKIDWCHTSGMGPRTLYAKWAMALHATARPIVFSICEWGRAHPWEWAPTLAHLWRTCWDIEPSWPDIMTILDRQASLHVFAGPDHWNDPDMLEVGNGELTASENRAHFALWAMLAAPLFAGNDLRTMNDDVRAILTAPELVALDQDPLGRQARRVEHDETHDVWTRELAGGAVAVALLNRSSEARELRLDPSIIAMPGARARVRDIIERRDLGLAAPELRTRLAAHSAAVLRIAGY